MPRDQVKEILDRVLMWPPERQADVAHVVELMEQQDRAPCALPMSKPLRCAAGSSILIEKPSLLNESSNGFTPPAHGVTFDRDASDDLDRVFVWIAKDNPLAGYEMVGRIEAKVMLHATPELTEMGHSLSSTGRSVPRLLSVDADSPRRRP